MNLKEIKEMISLMNDNELVELEVELDGTKIKIKKSFTEGAVPLLRPIPEYRVETQSSSAKPTDPAAANGKKTLEIKSPMVGTFYRTPSPEAPPFVDVGQVVEVGQVVCIVEAMKLMNEIKSEIRGKVVEVTVENAEPVEFGQKLFVVEPL